MYEELMCVCNGSDTTYNVAGGHGASIEINKTNGITAEFVICNGILTHTKWILLYLRNMFDFGSFINKRIWFTNQVCAIMHKKQKIYWWLQVETQVVHQQLVVIEMQIQVVH